MVVPFLTQTCGVSDLEPPRLCGATLTRCGNGLAILVGGLDEVSKPLSCMYKYAIQEKQWTELLPEMSLDHTSSVDPRRRRTASANGSSSRSATHPSTSGSLQQTSSSGAAASLFLPPRHGHSAAYDSVSSTLIIYGGIGAGGFDPSQVTEDGCQERLARRYGYLNDLWALDTKAGTLKHVEPKPNTAATEPASRPTDVDSVKVTEMKPEKSAAMFDSRWRHRRVLWWQNVCLWRKDCVRQSNPHPVAVRKECFGHALLVEIGFIPQLRKFVDWTRCPSLTWHSSSGQVFVPRAQSLHLGTVTVAPSSMGSTTCTVEKERRRRLRTFTCWTSRPLCGMKFCPSVTHCHPQWISARWRRSP